MSENPIKVIKKADIPRVDPEQLRQIKDEQRALLIITLARSYTIPLRALANEDMPREVAAVIYDHVMAIGNNLSRRHGFSLTSDSK